MRLFPANVFILIIALCGYHNFTFSQIGVNWSPEEIKSANTTEGLTYLNDVEKEAVIILNLSRLYPKKFVEVELRDFNGTPKYGDYLEGSKYKSSLIKTMSRMEPIPALTPDLHMSKNARCFALESGEKGYVGHKRQQCKKENYAECCSYGMESGKEIILQLLIDDGEPSLGHRKICFDSEFTLIGIGVAAHKKWDTCCVIEMI